ncbi:aspartate/glutamate racemase family protein [Amorphus sp. 3PC139-8]|uniref:arylmalonate decarboxylase n=1 Tax=Amorphus sp. 3PC139-8 TaxID=2735676 RepID=UPI00345D96EB
MTSAFASAGDRLAKTGHLPTIGMIVPPKPDIVPPEPLKLYPEGVRFLAKGLGLTSLTPKGYDQVIDRIAEASAELAEEGADAIALMGTSISFYRGHAFNAELVASMEKASGLPATTMSNAVIDALGQLGARRLTVATAYGDEVNQRLADFLRESGFDVLALESLGIVDVDAVFGVTSDDLLALGRRAAKAAPDADAMVLSCGGLRTLAVTTPLERETGRPIVSSAVAGAWAAVRLVGHNPSVAGYGRLLAGE